MTQEDDFVGRTVLGRFRIVRSLARGGQGAIYLARSEGAAGFVKPVVVKRILPQHAGDERLERMITREARILSTLRHPAVVNIIDFAIEDNAYVMVLDYVHGHTLGRWYRFVNRVRGPFPRELVLHIAIQILDALHYAHTQTGQDGRSLNIVHRDVTPSNVLIDVEGHVKLADFGIARTTIETTDAATQQELKGTFPYVAPELYLGAEPSPLSDVYGCGLVLHEVLSGKNEIKGKDLKETLYRALHHEPSRLDQVRDDISKGLADVVASAIAKDPGDRHRSARHFARALRAERSMEEDEAAGLMSKLAARDFHDSRLTSLLHVPSLTELENAWRSESGEGLSSSRPPPAPAEASSQPPTVAAGMSAETPTAPEGVTQAATAPLSPDAPARPRRPPPAAVARGDAEEPLDLSIAIDVPEEVATPSPSSAGRREGLPRSTRWLVPVLIIGGAGLLGGAIALGMRDSPEDPDREPQFILVTPAGVRDDGSGSGSGSNDVTEGEVDPDPGATLMEEPPPDPGMEEQPGGDRTETPRQRAARLSRTFARHHGRVTACIRQHAADAPEGGLTIRFTVDTAGRVEQAVVGPAAVRGTGLGECVAEVARSTEFGPQPERSTFSIPITVQRR